MKHALPKLVAVVLLSLPMAACGLFGGPGAQGANGQGAKGAKNDLPGCDGNFESDYFGCDPNKAPNDSANMNQPGCAPKGAHTDSSYDCCSQRSNSEQSGYTCL